MTVRVAVLDDYQNAAVRFGNWSSLEGRATLKVFNEHIADHEELVQALLPFEVVVAMRERTPFPRALLEALPNLELLITTGPTNDSFDISAAVECGIVVSGTGGLYNPTSELAWALILAVTRNLPLEDRTVREGGWQVSIGPELGGRTLGIVGLGRLGQRVAKVAHAFDMKVIAWSENLTRETAEKFGARLVAKDDLFSNSDIITIHLQLSDRTRGLITAREIGLMKPTGYLVNTARGPIVDEAALVDALRNNRIAGAGLDVFDSEPLPLDHPLRSMANTVITPHIGYVGTDIYEIFYRDIIEDIAGWLNGTPVRLVG